MTAELIRRFREDGAVCLRGVFRDWVEPVAAGIERSRTLPGPGAESLEAEGGPGRFYNDYCNWRRVPEFGEFVHRSAAGEIAARLMESRTAVFYHEHVLVKEPGALKPSPWHHDQPYYPVDGDQNCSLWLPVDPVPAGTCVRFVRGSHRWDRWFVPRKFASGRSYESRPGREAERFSQVPDIDARPGEFEILTWEMEPGDCVAFHMRTLHGAPGNASLTTPRRALATRWLGDDARFAERPWEISPPITGGLRPGDPMECEEFPLVWSRGG